MHTLIILYSLILFEDSRQSTANVRPRKKYTWLFRVLDPCSNPLHEWTRAQLDKTIEQLTTYITAYVVRRGNVPPEKTVEMLREDIELEVASFLVSSATRGALEFHKFWRQLRTVKEWPLLAQFATALGNSSTTEASVERVFKQLSSVLNKRRCSLASARADAALMLSINHKELHLEEFPAFVRGREKRAEKSVRRALSLSLSSPISRS